MNFTNFIHFPQRFFQHTLDGSHVLSSLRDVVAFDHEFVDGARFVQLGDKSGLQTVLRLVHEEGDDRLRDHVLDSLAHNIKVAVEQAP